MARSIKKERKPLSKKFWIITYIVSALVLIGIIIGCFVAYILNSTKDLVVRFD